MPPEVGFSLSSESAERLATMLRAFEGGRLAPRFGATEDSFISQPGDGIDFVQVTGTTTPAGDHTGKIVWWDNDNNEWRTDYTEIIIREPDGKTLPNGKYIGKFMYHKLISGTTTKDVYVTSSGPILSIQVVTDITCVSGVLTVTKKTLHIPGGRST
jgi:hypothetical protein